MPKEKDFLGSKIQSFQLSYIYFNHYKRKVYACSLYLFGVCCGKNISTCKTVSATIASG